MAVLMEVGQALARIQSLGIAECEREFSCEFRRDDANPGQYWAICPHLNIDLLDVRIGQTGGVVYARFEKDVQQILAEEVHSLGAPEDINVVSPPMSPASPSSWSRKWSVAHTIAGAKIWFGMEEIDGGKRLVSASRSFTTRESAC